MRDLARDRRRCGAGRGRGMVPDRLRWRLDVEFERPVRTRSPESQDRTVAAARRLPRPLRGAGRPRREDRPGRRHRRGGAGIRHVAGGRDRRSAHLRRDLGVDAAEPDAPRWAHLVPLARRSRRGPGSCLRRRPRRQPSAVGGRLPIQPARPSPAGPSSGECDPREGGRHGPGRARADGRPMGGRRADHDQPELLLAGRVRGAERRLGRTRAGPAWRRLHAGSRAS